MWVLVILGGLSAMLWQQVFLTIITNWFALLLIQGVLARLRGALGRADDRHAAPGPARQDRHGSAVRHPRPRPRAPAGLERRSRVRLAAGRRDARHAGRDLRCERPVRAAVRRLLQHPAARRRQRRGPRLHAVRQHLGGVGQRHHRRDDDHRHPARHAELPVRGGTHAGPLSERARRSRRLDVRLGERHQPAAHRGRGLPGRQRAVSRCRRERLRARPSRRPRMPRRESSASRSRTTSSSTCTDSRRSIDALGGVDITVEERLPKGGGPAYDGQPAEEWAIGWIEAGSPAHGRRHRAVVRPVALHDRRLRPHEAPASAAGGDPRAVHAADRADALPGRRDRRARTSSRPTCRSRCSRSSRSWR